MTTDEIDQVARRICMAHGLDPDEMVSVGDGATDTVFEAMTRGPSYRGMSCQEPRWRLFRSDASKAIAAHEAMKAAPRALDFTTVDLPPMAEPSQIGKVLDAMKTAPRDNLGEMG